MRKEENKEVKKKITPEVTVFLSLCGGLVACIVAIIVICVRMEPDIRASKSFESSKIMTTLGVKSVNDMVMAERTERLFQEPDAQPMLPPDDLAVPSPSKTPSPAPTLESDGSSAPLPRDPALAPDLSVGSGNNATVFPDDPNWTSVPTETEASGVLSSGMVNDGE